MASRATPSAFYAVTLLMPTGEHTILNPSDWYVWDAAQAAGVILPARCHQGHCLTCAGQIVGSGDFDQVDSRGYFPVDREAQFILLCTARPRSDLRIYTHRQQEMRIHRMSRGLPAPYA